MSFTARANVARIASLALVASLGNQVSCAEPHNLILFVPEALPAASVDIITAPTLARLRHEGVAFVNSHSGFPKLAPLEPGEATSDLNAEALLAAATENHAVAFVHDTRRDTLETSTEQSPALRILLTVTLPRFKALNRPFFLIYRLAEPAYTPPNVNDIRAAYTPSPRAADDALAAIEGTLDSLGLYDTTNIVVAAEHGLSRILKVSHTSHARVILDKDDDLGVMPPGFLAVDIIAALQTEDPGLTLFDFDAGSSNVDWDSGGHPQRGNAIIGVDPTDPHLRIEANGAHDAIYIARHLTKRSANSIAQVITEALFEQDYVSGVFVNEKRVGRINGALPLKHIARSDADDATQPDMVVTFTSVSTGCDRPTLCSAVIADTPVEEGYAIRASFTRAGTWTFMAARGPDFQSRHISAAPASNADISRTVAELLQLDVQSNGGHPGRVLAEGLRGYERRGVPRLRKQVIASTPSIEGLVTEIHLQSVGSRSYFDAADSSDAPRNQRVAQAERYRSQWHWPKFRKFTIEISPDD